MHPNTQPKKNPFSAYSLRSFLSFAKPWRAKMIWLTLLFVLANVAIYVQPIFIGKLVDAVSVNPINSDLAWTFAFILIATSFGHNFLWRIAEFLYRGLVFEISFLYETYLFRETISKPYPYFVDKFTGKIGSYITTTSSELKGLLDNAMFSYVSSIVGIISVVLIMASVNWQTALIIVVNLIAMVVVGRFTLAKDMAMQKIEADINSTKNGRIIDAIANFVSVKSFHKEATEHRTIESQQAETLKAGKRSFFWGIVFWGSQSVFVRDIMWPAIVLMNLWMFLDGQITIGQFTTVLSTAVLFTQSIWEVIWHISQFGQRVSKIEEAHTYLFGETNIVKNSGYRQDVRRAISFDHEFAINDLSFAYPDKDDVKVLSGVSLNIARGEKVGIVGRSGSGKSTLVKLLLDQYETTNGAFSLDGIPVSSKALSHMITYVPQDTTLFHRTIAENIAYATDEKVSRSDIVLAAKHAEADEFIEQLPNGYDTLVGERGVKLSGGQRQRIAIARAILRMNAPILVLDEATSALDSESEVYVQNALENLWQDKTVVAIAHRLSTLRTMDRIVVMDKGQIVECGTHGELLAASGTYAKLWNHQSGGFLEE